MRYDIVKSTTSQALVAVVNAKAKEGWLPFGGAFFAEGSFYQTVIKKN